MAIDGMPELHRAMRHLRVEEQSRLFQSATRKPRKMLEGAMRIGAIRNMRTGTLARSISSRGKKDRLTGDFTVLVGAKASHVENHPESVTAKNPSGRTRPSNYIHFVEDERIGDQRLSNMVNQALPVVEATLVRELDRALQRSIKRALKKGGGAGLRFSRTAQALAAGGGP